MRITVKETISEIIGFILKSCVLSSDPENEFALRRKDMHLESQLKKAQDAQSVQLAAAHTRLKKLNEEYETSMQECHAIASRKASHHVQVTHDLENQYEHKLALEMERYDALSEEIEAVQQRCEGLLEAQQTQHLIAIRNAEVRTKRVEKELRQQIDRLHEDARHNEQMFREVFSVSVMWSLLYTFEWAYIGTGSTRT